jgi:hypothetical protein
MVVGTISEALATDFFFHSPASVVYSESYTIWTKSNRRFAKLQSPLSKDRSRDRNQFIDPITMITIEGESLEIFEFWDHICRIIAAEQFYEIEGNIYEDVIAVLQAVADSRIERECSMEKNAGNIDLIYTELCLLYNEWNQCNSLTDCIPVPLEEKAEKGFILKHCRVE